MNAKQLAILGLKLNPEDPLAGAREVAKNSKIKRFPKAKVEKVLQKIKDQIEYANWRAEHDFH